MDYWKNKLGSSLGSFLRTLGDLMLLNLLWVVCSVPVFTIGPATSALCRVLVREVRDEPVYVLRDFFGAFRRDFLKALVLGLIGVAGVLIAAVDFRFAVAQVGWMRMLFMGVAIIVSTLVLSYLAYVFMLHAFFDNSIGGHIKNALAFAISSPKDTVGIWLCFAVPILIALLLPEAVVIYLGSLYILLGISAPAYLAARLQAKVLQKIQNPENRDDQNNDT